ncbi:MAG: hypothetical protein KY476_05265 [Planctomycetes bacterium]|nr:hypothetical protein [Planctomycetota bacterium]
MRETLRQYAALFQSMTPSQRGTLVLVPLVIGGAFALLLWGGSSSSYTALSWGKTFTSEELMSAEQTLIEAGLTDFRREGQKLLVPTAEVDRYNASLLEGGTLPQGWGDELERQLVENSSPFRTRQTSEAARDVALARALRRMIQAVPDIEYADVTWTPTDGRRRLFGPEAKVTATVSVRPRKGRQVSTQLVQSLRSAVASMVPDLAPTSVTVFDLSEGRAWTGSGEDDPFDNRILERIRQFQSEFQAKITEALSYVPNVLVTVHVDIDHLKSSVKRQHKVDPKQRAITQENNRVTDDRFTQQPVQGEPGVGSNQPRSLGASTGTQQVRSNTVEEGSTVAVPSVEYLEEELIGAMPKAVQVSIKIPEDYYEAVAARQGIPRGESEAEQAAFRKAIDEIRQREEAKARATAAILIPAGSPDSAVDVSSFTSVETPADTISVSVMDTVWELASRWWSALALALFAAWALVTLRRNMPKLPESGTTPPPVLDPISPMPSAADEAEPPIEIPKRPAEPSRRDRIQSIVRDNPEMTATLLGKWIEAAK